MASNFQSAISITPSDSTDLSSPVSALWLGTAGHVVVQNSAGVSHTFNSVAGGWLYLGFLIKRVLATGTTATNIVGVFNSQQIQPGTQVASFAITPSDTVNCSPVDSIFVGTAGDLTVLAATGQQVTFKNVPSGLFSGINVVRIYATGTTATGFIGAQATGWAPGSGTLSQTVQATTVQATSVNLGGITWTKGTGSPLNVVTAPVGSLYSRTDGGASTTLYVKESGAGSTGWVAK